MDDSHYRSVKDVLSFFKVDSSQGLTAEQVSANRKQYGLNEMPPPEKSGWLELIIKQFEDQLVLILLGSAVISFVLGFLEENASMFDIVVEPTVILVILILNAIVGVWQESSAEEAIEKLKEFEARTALVIRDGESSNVDRSELVPGDLVKLVVGQKVPADCRLVEFESYTFTTDESMLTGETTNQQKILETIAKPNVGAAVDQDKKNIAFSGTLVTHGNAFGVVVLTGSHTSMGQIQAGLLEQSEQKTPLGEKLDEFAELLSKVILGICVLVWLININHFADHGGWFAGSIYYFKIAVALAVAAIPEGLPAVVTTCLALGTRKMAENKAIVRSLPSVETLGCTTVVCSDKTGTLTTNQMTVRRILMFDSGVSDGSMSGKANLNVHEFELTGSSYNPTGQVIDASDRKALRFAASGSQALRWISKICSLCNDSEIRPETIEDGSVRWHINGTPTEGALKVLSEKLHIPDAEFAADIDAEGDVIKNCECVSNYWLSRFTKVKTLEFTRDRKSMSTFVKPAEVNEDEILGSSPDSKGRRRSQRIARQNSNSGSNTSSDSTDNYSYLLVKGAPEELLKRSAFIFMNSDESLRAMTSEHAKEIEQYYTDNFASKGLRCIGLAYKRVNVSVFEQQSKQFGDNFAEYEKDLVFVGVAGMLDPPREEVAEAISVCNLAGMRVIVITGDNKKTAEAICRQIGIFDRDENLEGKSYTGSEFSSLSLNQKITAVNNASLFSRVMPAHKLELVNLLRDQKEVVAMTGDGVNDAPALKKADIGISMGTGTEVAKHASHMVLEDDNFATIVKAVKEGRAIYANTKQFIRYLISSNIGEVACIFLTAAMGLPEALIPVQLLWVNLVTDGLPATALGFNKPDKDIMRQPPRGRTEKIIDGWMFFRYFLIGIYVGIATVLGFIWWFCMYENGPQMTLGELTNFHKCGNPQTDYQFVTPGIEGNCGIFYDNRPSSISLSILVTIEMFNTFNALSENQSLFVVKPWDNIWVVLAVMLSMLLHCGILYIGVFRDIFKTAALNSEEWMAVMVISFPVIILDEILKAITRSMEDAELRLKKKLRQYPGLTQFSRFLSDTQHGSILLSNFNKGSEDRNANIIEFESESDMNEEYQSSSVDSERNVQKDVESQQNRTMDSFVLRNGHSQRESLLSHRHSAGISAHRGSYYPSPTGVSLLSQKKRRKGSWLSRMLGSVESYSHLYLKDIPGVSSVGSAALSSATKRD